MQTGRAREVFYEVGKVPGGTRMRVRVRLEDCSGRLLGNLPQDPVGKDGCDGVGDTNVSIRQPVFQLVGLEDAMVQ